MREKHVDPYRQIEDLERALKHQRELTKQERQRANALEQSARQAWATAWPVRVRREAN